MEELGLGIAGIIWFFIVLAWIWSMVWKGIALWRAGRNGHLAWFIIMFIINTLGILEIIYIFGFSRKKVTPAQPTQPA
ncbi:MAG: hypothetical protein C4555_05340 [Dehalococcoidia bacterium]|jgi:methionyl-tRNA synthetase|nr:MAG: hypothetical protein C4555_05340 [Dehalococcoidia bacterium]